MRRKARGCDDTVDLSFSFPFGRMVVVGQLLERVYEDRAGNPKFFQTLFHRAGQNPLALSCQFHKNACTGTRAPDQIIGLRSVDQLHSTVVAAPKLVRQGPDCTPHVIRKTSYCKQQLILSWFDTRGSGGLIAEIQVAVDMVSKFGQCPKVRFLGSCLDAASFCFHYFVNIVTR